MLSQRSMLKERGLDHRSAMLKLVSKGLNVGAEVLRYQGLCFLIIIITVSGPVVGPSSVRQLPLR